MGKPGNPNGVLSERWNRKMIRAHEKGKRQGPGTAKASTGSLPTSFWEKIFGIDFGTTYHEWKETMIGRKGWRTPKGYKKEES
jgi:hypothetical protein